MVDPVDPRRNVAAVLSPAAFAAFASRCRQFIARPGERFFFPRPLPPKPAALLRLLRSRGTRPLALAFPRPNVVDDIVFPQLRRSAGRLEAILQEAEFRVLGTAVHADARQCLILLELETWSLPSIRKVVGPPLFVRQHADEFRAKYRKGKLWIEGDRWVAETARIFPQAETLLRQLLRTPPAKLEARGIASFPAKGFRRARLLEAPALAALARDPQVAAFLRQYLTRDID